VLEPRQLLPLQEVGEGPAGTPMLCD
jgi:hypothetical protein